MGRKSAAKEQRASSGSGNRPTDRKTGTAPILFGVMFVALLCIGLFGMWGRNGSAETTTAEASTATPQANAPDPREVAKNEAAAAQRAALGPHKQANLPPIPVRGYAPPRPMATVQAAYQFAAEHPEVLSYVPCFCGCQHNGHRGNDECFVKSRAGNGDVVEWEEHGIECAVCIDVATRARQMHASGASVTDIRAAVEKEFAPAFPSMTATPKPHSH
jgi:hypothetical protein